VLDLRPNCECCNKDLPPEATDVVICSFECTFCRDCVETTLGGRCPNCGGELVARPIRPAEKLDDRFHESCHKRGIHLSSQTPISAVGGLGRRVKRNGSVAAGD
jgi:uncharacterized protein